MVVDWRVASGGNDCARMPYMHLACTYVMHAFGVHMLCMLGTNAPDGKKAR